MRLFHQIELHAISSALLGLGASIVVGLFCYFGRAPARRWGLTSQPRPDRFGDGRVPLVGGPALFLGMVVALVFLRVLPPWLYVLGGAGAFLIGLADDRREMQPGTKLTAQVALALAMGALVSPTWGTVGLLVALTVFLLNSSNYLDNMDALLVGVALTQSVVLAMLGLRFGAPTGGGALLLCSLPAILLLSIPPARVFLGDSGSHLIGALLACDAAVLLIGPYGVRAPVLLPLLFLFAPQVADFATVSVSRVRRGVPIWRGGTDHLSHRLVRAGFSVPQAVLILVLASAVCGACSLLFAL